MVPVPRSRGFTLIELLVVVSVIALLIAILLPALGRAREVSNRSSCAANVRSILQSMTVYGNQNQKTFPIVPNAAAAGTYVNDPSGVAGTNTDPNNEIQNSYNGTATGVGNPLRCLWLMVLDDVISPKSFLCKSDKAINGASPRLDQNTGMLMTNFKADGVSYSVAYPWHLATNQGHEAAYWQISVEPDVAIVSDMAPQNDTGKGNNRRKTNTAYAGTGAPTVFNSANHDGTGQNVGFGDTHVEWTQDPYVGQFHDNIFTYRAASNTLTPYDTGNVVVKGTAVSTVTTAAPFDTYMVPVRSLDDNSM